ncbi:hypothetical protein [Streptomyces fungicidicus]|uniref:hypothetical protein n=1 Tax=Streptomyces fungicidicus TaxID=68203 RepID=UPI003808D095
MLHKQYGSETPEVAVGHVESAHLVELALGHATGDDDVGALRHIASCPHCREELRQLSRLVAAARDAEVADLPAAPPGHVWRRIAREVSHETAAPPPPGRRPARAGFLVVTLVAGAALLRRLWAAAGRGALRRRGRNAGTPPVRPAGR